MNAAKVLLFACFGVDPEPWALQFARSAPDLEVRYWPDVGSVEEVDFALTWNHPPGLWADFTNLKAIFSAGAGVDQLMRDPALPRDVPVVRLVDPSLVIGMGEFVLMRVLHYHRDMPAYAASQRAARWEPRQPRLARERVVGVMGLGQLGASCALLLARQGFAVRGWSRRPKSIEGVRTWSGWSELPAFLSGCEILICLLPLTAETEDILNTQLFDRLAPGACLINVGRGRHLAEEDLLAALGDGRLSGATLDVLREEPLPSGHAFWNEPRITITPHISAPTLPETAVPILLRHLQVARAGAALQDVVDRDSGY